MSGRSYARERGRNRYSCATRSAPLGTLPNPRRHCARHYLDSRRPRGHARRRCRRSAEAEPRLAAQQRAGGPGEQRIPCGRSAGGNVFRLADGSARPQEALLYHARRLSRRHGCHRAVMEFLEFRLVSIPDRGGYRRRVHGHQFHHPRAGSGACARLDRPRHQRQLLGRCRRGRGRVDRAARPVLAARGHRLARCLRHWRRIEPDHSLHAHVASGKPALAGHAWSRCRG